MSDGDLRGFLRDLKRWQVARRLTNAQMALLLGVPRSTYTTYVLGHRKPGMRFVARVSRVRGFGYIARPYLRGER